MRKTWTTIALMATILLISGNAQAQNVPEVVVSWDISMWAAGVNPDTGTPVIPVFNILKSATLCNQPIPANGPTPLVNPTRFTVADPDNAGRACIGNIATQIMSIPVQNGIFSTTKARGATLVSDRSAASNPFNRVIVVVAPVVPTDYRIIP